jgi:hypothetical protein
LRRCLQEEFSILLIAIVMEDDKQNEQVIDKIDYFTVLAAPYTHCFCGIIEDTMSDQSGPKQIGHGSKISNFKYKKIIMAFLTNV